MCWAAVLVTVGLVAYLLVPYQLRRETPVVFRGLVALVQRFLLRTKAMNVHNEFVV